MTDSVPEIETESPHASEVSCCCARFSDSDVAWLRRPSSITCIVTLHSTLLWFDILHLGYGYSLCSRYHMFCTPFFGILRCVGYGLSVCDAVLRECIAMPSRNTFHSLPQMVPGTLSMIGLSHSTHQFQAPRIMSRTHCRRHPTCASVLAEKS
jgi:hypothetical protein